MGRRERRGRGEERKIKMKDDLCVTCEEFSRLGYLFVKTFNGRRCERSHWIERRFFFSLSSFLPSFLSFFPIATRAANEKEIDMHDTWCVIGDCFDMGWAEVQPTVPTANRSPSSNGTRY